METSYHNGCDLLEITFMWKYLCDWAITFSYKIGSMPKWSAIQHKVYKKSPTRKLAPYWAVTSSIHLNLCHRWKWYVTLNKKNVGILGWIYEQNSACNLYLNNVLKSLRTREVFQCMAHKRTKLECGPMPNVMAALPNIGGTLCSTPQSLADAHY